MKHRFVVFDGPDGAGKTTSAQIVAQSVGYLFYKTPPASFRERRARFDTPGIPTRERFLFYADGLDASAADILAHMETPYAGVVLDRYTASAEIYHSEMDTATDYASLLRIRNLPKEDILFVLTADVEILLNRIRQRDARTDVHIETNADLIARVTRRFQSLYGDGVIHIDTGRYGPEEVQEQCFNLLRD